MKESLPICKPIKHFACLAAACFLVTASIVPVAAAEDAPAAPAKAPVAGDTAVAATSGGANSGTVSDSSSVDDLLNKEAPGKAPTNADIETAYQSCLKFAESDANDLEGLSDQEKKDSIADEKKHCEEAKTKCLKDAKTIFCASFVDDHLEEEE